MVLWMVLQCGRWCPYDDFDVKAYFAKPEQQGAEEAHGDTEARRGRLKG